MATQQQRRILELKAKLLDLSEAGGAMQNEQQRLGGMLAQNQLECMKLKGQIEMCEADVAAEQPK